MFKSNILKYLTNSLMLRRLWFVVAIFFATTLLFVVNRAIFLIYYHDMAADYSFAEIMQTFVHGFSLDCTTAGYVTALPLLATIAAIWIPVKERGARIWRRVFTAYFAIMLLAITLIETADIGMFGDWQARIDAQVLIYSPNEMLASVSLANAIAALLYIAATMTVALWLYRRIVRKLFMPTFDASNPILERYGIGLHSERIRTALSKSISSVVMLLAMGLLFIVIRGGLTPATANISKAFFTPKMFLNQVAVNPVFSFISTVVEGDDLNRYNFFEEEVAESLFAEAMAAEGESPAEGESRAWLRSTRPNVVIVITEGMGRTITDAYEGEEAVTPNIHRLKAEGIWFENMYASSFRTDRGTVALLSGFPAQPKMSIMKYPNKAAKLPGIAAAMAKEGYRSRFIYGGDANFTDTRAYLFAMGFEEVADEREVSFGGHRSKWGSADDAVLNYASDHIISRIRESEAPTLDVILTLSSHEPFDVPYSRLSDDMFNAFAFTDEEVGLFVERLRATPEWENMLVVIIPDHGYAYPVNVGNNTPERHHIPMLWLGGAVAEPRIVEEYASQTDLVATLLGQMGIAHDDFIFSRDISSNSVSHFGYWSYNDGFGIIDSEGVTIYDHVTESTVRNEGENGERRLNRGKAILQKTFSEIRRR